MKMNSPKCICSFGFLSVLAFGSFCNLSLGTTVKQANVSDDLVTSLPNLTFPLSSRHFSGYLSSLNSTNLFYWFTESQSNPVTDPLLVWLSGGPGCSSLFGSFAEIGPVLIHASGKLTSNEYAWNRKANLLFIESPAGVGFSYRANFSKYETNDAETAQINFHALKSFYAKFPQFTLNSFYIAGQSYASRFIVYLSQVVFHHKFPLNFRGIAVGNGDYSPELDNAFFLPTLKVFSIDDFSWHPMANFTQKRWKYNLRRSCDAYGKLPYQEIYIPASLHLRKPLSSLKSCGNEVALTWYFNQPTVLHSIHAHLDSGSSENSQQSWKMCSFIRPRNFDYLESDESLAPQLHSLASRGLQILLYNGDSDAVCNYLSVRHFLNQFSKVGERVLFEDRGHVYGTVQKYEKNITFVRFFGSGHLVPIDEPKGALKMINQLLLMEHK